jgi:tRNA pseudouridine13 synthase
MRRRFDLPYLTADLPGTGGAIKAAPEDFVVEERALYEPSGEGSHVFLWIEKRGITTFEVIHRLAGALGVDARDIGYAGLKDAQAVARQYLSVEHVTPEKALAVASEDFRVLDARRNPTKLRMGHLAGNYFRVTVRGCVSDAVERARAVLDRLVAGGMPNFYGPQRFGSGGRNAVVGKALVRERYNRAIQALFAPARSEAGSSVAIARGRAWESDYNGSLKLFPASFTPERNVAIAMRKAGVAVCGGAAAKRRLLAVLRQMPKRYIEFYVSALQSELFNEVVKARFDSLGTVLAGDLAWLHDKGAVFLVEDPAAESARAERFEISPSGPVFGWKMAQPQGRPGEIEAAVLERAHLTLRDFRMTVTVKNKGVRRPLRVGLTEVSVEPSEGGFTVGFALPKGSFATVALREIMKPESWDALV